MTKAELIDAKKRMIESEHLSRWEQCQDRGGCSLTITRTSDFPQEYCSHCLTLYANGYALDSSLR